MAEPVLRMQGITKRFGPVLALDAVDFDLRRGEIHALLGVNGAGKSTLIKILSGLVRKDAGTLEIDGRACEFATPREALRAGIAAVQQHPELVSDLSGIENIYLGQEAGSPGLFRRIDREAMRRGTAALQARFGVEIEPSREVGAMAPVDRETIAILHALRHEATRILVLDEPTSTLSEREKVQLFRLMRSLKESGIAIVYITHHLEEVFEIADRFTVFRAGRRVATMESAEARAQKISLPGLMLDQWAGELFPPKAAAEASGALLLETRALSLEGAFTALDLEARKGEIVGIFGLVGSGIDELAKALFGITRPVGGELRIEGRIRRFKGAHEALRAGLFLVPGDRRAEGLTGTRDVVFNATLAHLGRASWPGGLLRFWRNRTEIARLAALVALHPMRLWQSASSFSGGNQQKIVIAKGLYRRANIYIFSEPTIGVDIGARAKIYALLRDLSRDAAVIVLSSDCDEVHGLADRVMALYRGQVALPMRRGVDRDELFAAGMGSASA